MTAKHTPAPWIHDGKGFIFIVNEYLDHGEPAQEQQLVAQCSDRDGDLIAAAPELLEAADRCQITLMKLYRAFKVTDPTEGAFEWIKDVADAAQKAIDKAKGGAQ